MTAAEPHPPEDAARRIILGTTVRTLGAWPAGWRHEGAHRDPVDDARELRRIATVAESAGLDFLYFGDWLATSAEYEFTDPYLLARIEPFAAIALIAGITDRIGLIATASSSHSEPYSTARTAASIDLLSAGRVGVAVTSGAETLSANNFGWSSVRDHDDRIASADEFIQVLRGLWDSWDDDAFVSDVATGRLIEPGRLHRLDFAGRYRSSAGPLNVVRPPQGHLPIAIVGASPSSRALAARSADIQFVSPGTLEEAVDGYRASKRAVEAAGRRASELSVIIPIFPIVAETTDDARRLYDRLVDLVQVQEVQGAITLPDLSADRTLAHLATILRVSLPGVHVDDPVPLRVAREFSEQGKNLLALVRSRSGRTVGGHLPVTYRHLLVAATIPARIVVGSAQDIADHLETWFRAEATDGFTILTAITEQLEAFARLVVPELQRRGLVRQAPPGVTLRERLGLERPESTLRLP